MIQIIKAKSSKGVHYHYNDTYHYSADVIAYFMLMKRNTLITESAEETHQLGERLVKTLKGGQIIALYGELGSGKTTFVQGLAKGLEIKKRIISPTFIIVRTYKLKSQNSKRKTTAQSSKLFYHIDLYRINSDREIEGLGLNEILNDKDSIIAIEWAEKMEGLLPKKRVNAYFKYVDKDKRKIKINYG